MAAADRYADITVALPKPPGFDLARLETWPHVVGRLEYVAGRLEYRPPCGKNQQRAAVEVATELNLWRRSHPQFVVGGNEAGMLLEGEVRGADAAVWRAGEVSSNEFSHVPPLLAVEIVGADDTLESLRERRPGTSRTASSSSGSSCPKREAFTW